jgi:hypothetical protein
MQGANSYFGNCESEGSGRNLFLVKVNQVTSALGLLLRPAKRWDFARTSLVFSFALFRRDMTARVQTAKFERRIFSNKSKCYALRPQEGAN